MAYKRNPRRRVIRGSSSDELRRGGRRTSEEFDIDADADFVRLGSSVIGTNQDAVQRIGDAIIGGDFSGNTRGQTAIDIQVERGAATNVASGEGAVVFGRYIQASGYLAVAIGASIQGSADYSIGFGTDVAPTGYGARAIGNEVVASGDYTLGVGDQITVSGINAVAFGSEVQATAARAIGIGQNVEASGVEALGIGFGVGATAEGAVAIGRHASSTVVDQAVIAAQTLKMQTAYSPSAVYESVITTSDAAPATGNVATFADVDRIQDGGVALSALAPLSSPVFSDVVTLPAGGSASAPVLTFDGDTNTGLFRISADRWALCANGQIAAIIHSSGGVGRFGVNDTDQSHLLAFSSGENLSADRVLAWVLGDADRTVTIPATGTVALLEEDNVFEGATNTFEGDVDIDGDLAVGGDATITGTVQAAAAWIPGVAVSLNAKLYCGFNGDEPYETDYTGSSTGHRGQTGTETGGVIYRPGKFGKAAQSGAATTNYVRDPSFQLGAWTYWTLYGTVTRSFSSTVALYGSQCAKFINAGTTGGVYHRHTTSTGGSWTTSAWVYISAYTSGRIAIYCTITYTDASVEQSTVSSNTTLTGQWQRLTVTQAANGAKTVQTVDSYVALFDSGTATWYADAVQLGNNAYATPYCDGSLGAGHTWSGTTNASASSRTAASVYYANPLSAIAGTVSLWWQPAAAASVLPDALLWSEGNLRCWFDTAANTLKFSDGTNTVTTAAQTFAAGGWLHVACVWSSSGLVLYVNGVSAASGGTYTAPTLGASLYVGSDTAGANQCNGLVDDLAILTRAASADEIRAIYESQSQLICS